MLEQGQSSNEDSLKIFGEGHWYWIHEFVALHGDV